MRAAFILVQATANRIAEAAWSVRPHEHCAALLGSCSDLGELRVLDQLRLRNADGRPGRFALADADLIHAGRVAADRGLALIAWLHSHPSGSTELSLEDRESLALSRLPWLIAACREEGSAVFAGYSAGAADPIPVVIRH